MVELGAIKTEFYGTSRQFIKPTTTQDYDAFVAKCEKVAMDSGHKGEDPSVVAATIFKAAHDRSRKLRFPVGSPAPMLLRLRKFLSDNLWFMVVRSSYKI